MIDRFLYKLFGGFRPYVNAAIANLWNLNQKRKRKNEINHLNISESAAVQMPMKTVASLIILVAMGVFAYTELTSRLVSVRDFT